MAKDGNAGIKIPVANILAASIYIMDGAVDIFAICATVKQGANLKSCNIKL
jgi:hypothetical protein